MATIEELVREIEAEAGATRVALARIPGDKLGWQPHEKSMSLGQLALHIAGLPLAIARLSLLPSMDAGRAVPLPHPADVKEILRTHDEAIRAAIDLLRGMGEPDLEKPWRMVDGERVVMAMPRGLLLRHVLLNHWYHHRGQLTVYLRLVGAPVPAIYGPSADEHPFA